MQIYKKCPVFYKINWTKTHIAMKGYLMAGVAELMILTPQEEEYLNAFEGKEYKPELLFSDEKILTNIKNHPMAIWKMEQRS